MGKFDVRRQELNIGTKQNASIVPVQGSRFDKRRTEFQKQSEKSGFFDDPNELREEMLPRWKQRAIENANNARQRELEAQRIQEEKNKTFQAKSTAGKYLEAIGSFPNYAAKSLTGTQSPQQKAAEETMRAKGQEIYGTVMHPFDAARNAVASTLKESASLETFDPIGNAPKLGTAFIEGLTGKRKTSSAEIMPEPYRKWAEEHPKLSGLPNLVLDIVTDPTTYIGGGGLLKIEKAIELKMGKKITTVAEKATVRNLIKDVAKNEGIDIEKGVQATTKTVNAPKISTDIQKPPAAEVQLQNEITTANPQKAEQLAEELRGLNKDKTQSIPAKVTHENVEIPAAGKIDSTASQKVKAGTTMAERELSTVGKGSAMANRKVKAYMFENPEVKDYYQTYAKYILDDEFVPNEQIGRTTNIMKKLKADTGLKPADIKDALERLVKNHGQENVAAAKRIELVIDDMLSNGFDSVRGEKVSAIDDYLKLKSEIEGREIKPTEPNTLDNIPAENNYAKPVEQPIKLPETEEGLTKFIDGLKQKLDQTTDETEKRKINLQLFAADEKLKEVSKFKTNTLKKAPELSDDELQKAIEEIDMTYGVKTNKESIKRGQEIADIANNATIESLRKNGLKNAEDTAAAFFITKKLAAEAKALGDYTKLKSFLKGVQRSATSQGQTIQTFKIWQQDPDGMLKNATKIVEDAEDAIKKSNPEKIKQIDKATDDIIDAVDKTDKEAAGQIVDEVNKKADEVLGKKKTSSKKDSLGKPGEPKEKEELLPEDMLANKIENYTKDPKIPDSDPVKDMVNELFRVAKESPIERTKVKSKSAIEFVAEALRNRQEYVKIWKKAKEIVREKVKDNSEALAKLEAYFDKGIKPPFSSENFSKSIQEGMKNLNQNLGQIVKNYYAIGSKSREELAAYLVKKSGLSGENAEVLAKYVQKRMKELTKETKEKILKGIFKGETAKTAKSGAIKSVEELSNVGAFVNENYKTKVTEKLNPRLQKLINENFKGSPVKKGAETATDNRIDFGELVRKSVSEIDFTRTKFVKEISEKLQVNDIDARTILSAIEQRFNDIVQEKRQSILGNMFNKREATVKKTGIQRVQEYIDKQVELENLGANPDAIRDFIKEKYGLPTLTNDDMAFIADNIDKLKGIEQGTRLYNETLWRIYNCIESKVPSTFIDKFRAWQRISMLPNIKTFGRNILGNVFMEKMENFNELTTTALVDWITSAFTGKREIIGSTAAIRKSVAQTKGKIQGLTDVITDIKHKVNTYDVQGQYEINVSKNAFKNPVLNALEQFTNKTLQFGDRPFYEAAKARRLKELQIIKKTKEITEEMEANATLYALDRTFQNNSQLAGAVLKAKKLMDNPVYEAIANVVVPFAKTPANILDKISDYTPIGLGKAMGHLIKTGGKGTFNQLYFSQRLGRALTGGGILTLGYVLASKGIITGAPEKPGSKKAAFDRSTGKLSYAFKIGNEYITYDWVQPVGALLALGADAYKSGMDKTSFADKAMSGTEGAGNTFFNMSMLRNFSSLLNYGNPVGGLIKTLLGAGQQFTPTSIKQAMKIGDQFERDTYDPDKLKAIYNQYKANVPGLRQELPIKSDAYGQPMKVQEGYGLLQKIFNIAANPATVTKSNLKDYEREVERLYNLNKNSAVLPSILDKVVEDNNVDYNLTDEQFAKYKNLYGENAVNGIYLFNGKQIKGLQELVNNPQYKALSDGKKIERVSNLITKARNKAKSQMLKEIKPAGK